jgi:hypothetical protein
MKCVARTATRNTWLPQEAVTTIDKFNTHHLGYNDRDSLSFINESTFLLLTFIWLYHSQGCIVPRKSHVMQPARTDS